MLQSVLWIQSFCRCPSVCQFYLIAWLNKVKPTPTTWPNMVKCVVPTWHIMDTEKCLSDQNSAEPVAHKVQFVPKSQISETDTAVNMVNGRIPSQMIACEVIAYIGSEEPHHTIPGCVHIEMGAAGMPAHLFLVGQTCPQPYWRQIPCRQQCSVFPTTGKMPEPPPGAWLSSNPSPVHQDQTEGNMSACNGADIYSALSLEDKAYYDTFWQLLLSYLSHFVATVMIINNFIINFDNDKLSSY